MKTKVIDRNIQGKCKLCDTEFIHEWSSHIFNTLDAIEECKYLNKVIKHHKDFHREQYIYNSLDAMGVYLKKIVKGLLKDILGIILLPFSFTVSVFYKVFEWLNDRIGLFD